MKREKGWQVLLIPLIFLFLMVLSTYGRCQNKKQDAVKLRMQEKSIQELLDAGFEKEAMKAFDRMGEKTKRKLDSLYFRTLVSNLRLDQAERMFTDTPSLLNNPKNLVLLSHQYQERNLYPKALSLFCRYQKKIDPKTYQEELTSLLKKVRISSCQERFIDGWFQQKAIGKSDKGFFLLDSDGNPIDYESYDLLLPWDQGFYCQRKGKMFLLNEKGRFVEFVQEQKIEQKEKQKEKQKDKEGIVRVFREGNLFGYRFEDQTLIEPKYDFASPVSDHGTAYVFLGNEKWKIRFLALESLDR